MFRHALEAEADHLPEAHFHAQIALSNGIEPCHQHPLCLTAVFLKRDGIDGRWRRWVSVGIPNGSPHKSFRRDDLLKDAIDRVARAIGGLHHMVPRATLAQIHLAHGIREPRSAIPLRDMLGIRNSGPNECSWRVKETPNDNLGPIYRTDIYRCSHRNSLVAITALVSRGAWPYVFVSV